MPKVAVRLADPSLPSVLSFAERHGLALRHYVTEDIVLFESVNSDTISFQRNLTRVARSSEALWSAEQHPLLRAKRTFDDPLFPLQWHLEADSASSINAQPVWDSGNHGSGVVVAVVDDGLDHSHPDFASTYSAECSYDFNFLDDDPMPTLKDDVHGTRCAGEVAAGANDGTCGVGVAYEAKVAGLRILSGEVNDATEASALSYKLDKVSIYSSSWGPYDDGKTVEAPGPLTSSVLANGVQTGRGGRGSIFVFASGNGGSNDDCNYDGYSNSIYTIAIGAVDRNRKTPTYQENCAAQLAVTFSSNANDYITTTDVNGQCTKRMGGTSAAAPLAAGIFALVLSARPDLTWRDLQWLVATTAVPIDDGGELVDNAAGLRFSQTRGFGLLDAERLVRAAETWTLVGAHIRAQFPADDVGSDIPQQEAGGDGLLVTKTVVAPKRMARLEHVQVSVTVEHKSRGDLSYELTCPSGTRSLLARARRRDTSLHGLSSWTFMTVACWGEDPNGTYELRVRDTINAGSTGKLVQWALKLNGERQETDEQDPTDAPTAAPSDEPTGAPTEAPTAGPTDAPTTAPTSTTPTDSPATPVPSEIDTLPTDAPVEGEEDEMMVSIRTIGVALASIVVALLAFVVYKAVAKRREQAKLQRSLRVRLDGDEEPILFTLDTDENDLL